MNATYWLILGILGVWRVTHLLYAEDGPFRLLARLRRLAGQGFWGGLLDCFYCLSLWMAVPFAWFLGAEWKERLLLWPALSGGAILLERATARPAPSYSEDPVEPSQEVAYELLRKGTRPGGGAE
jgi:hypothetical protein